MKDIQKLAKNPENYLKFQTDKIVTWCSGCGDYGILNALQIALALEGIPHKDLLVCFDIGCHGNASDKIETNTIHGLHGRVLPLAAGATIANDQLKVIAMAGDGGTFSEGLSHLVHAIRNNYDITFLHFDNKNYGLTTGQASSLSPRGSKRNSAEDGVEVDALNPLEIVLSSKPSFVARTFSGDVDHMAQMIRAGLNHDGFSFIEILQACPTYNKESPDSWYQQRIKNISEIKNYDKTDIWQAKKIVEDLDDKIYLGLLYEDKNKKSFLKKLNSRQGKKTSLVEEVKHFDISELVKDFN